MSPADLLDSGRVVLNLGEAATVLDVDRRTLSKAIQDGVVPAVQVGRRVLVPVAGLRELLGVSQRKGKGAPAEA